MDNKQKTSYLKAILCIALVSFGIVFGFSQTNTYQVSTESGVQVTGTSSMHDWKMDASIDNCSIEVSNSSNENILELVAVEFQLPSNMLKSEHKKMDALAHKALKRKEFPNILFKSNSLQSIVVNNKGIPSILTGILEIAGVKKEIELNITTELDSTLGRLFLFTVPINMEDYQVEPPSLMFGAITTGSEVLASFKMYFNKLN